MKKVGEVLANSICNLYKENYNSAAWQMSCADRSQLEQFSKEKLVDMVSTLSCGYIDVVHNVGRIRQYIEFCRANENEL